MNKFYKKSAIKEIIGVREIAYQYRATRIVSFQDLLLGRVLVRLDSGGWWTVSTKRNINQILAHYGVQARVVRKDGNWFLCRQNDSRPFYDGMFLPLSIHERKIFKCYLYNLSIPSKEISK